MLGIPYAQLYQWTGFCFLATALLSCVVAEVVSWPQPSMIFANNISYPQDFRQDYTATLKSMRQFEDRQKARGVHVVSDEELRRHVSVIQMDATAGQFEAARKDLANLKLALINWDLELGGGPNSEADSGTYIPILLYHYPPPDFEYQLIHLEEAGYTTIDLNQAVAGLHGGPLPAKPVVITFDDGFAPQETAAAILERHQMKATFYIIDGGPASGWCVGAGRRYGDPLQPSGGCGDEYLSWDQVRAIDRNPLFTIGAHTVDHANLTMLSTEEQRFEIIRGKTILEEKLGHVVKHFCYPYGAYTDESIALAKEAGFITATTVIPDTVQPAGSEFELRRIRDAMQLQ